MTLQEKTTQDLRLNEVLELILQLTSGNLQVQGTPSERGDELDAIITGLNMLGEELFAAFSEISESRNVLEASVKERTSELAFANEKMIGLLYDLEARNHVLLLLGEMGKQLLGNQTSEEAYATIQQSVQKFFPYEFRSVVHT